MYKKLFNHNHKYGNKNFVHLENHRLCFGYGNDTFFPFREFHYRHKNFVHLKK